MVALVEVAVSDQLIIRACNTTMGSGGVKNWTNRVGFATLQSVRAKAKVGDPLNHKHLDFYSPGCYKTGFTWKRGGNQHKTWIVLANMCPHARFVERGRPSTKGSGNKEIFTWSKAGGALIKAKDGTRGFKGNPILYPTANRIAVGLGMRRSLTLQSVKAAVR